MLLVASATPGSIRFSIQAELTTSVIKLGQGHGEIVRDVLIAVILLETTTRMMGVSMADVGRWWGWVTLTSSVEIFSTRGYTIRIAFMMMILVILMVWWLSSLLMVTAVIKMVQEKLFAILITCMVQIGFVGYNCPDILIIPVIIVHWAGRLRVFRRLHLSETKQMHI